MSPLKKELKSWKFKRLLTIYLKKDNFVSTTKLILNRAYLQKKGEKKQLHKLLMVYLGTTSEKYLEKRNTIHYSYRSIEVLR